jgi:hypothetical protein
MNDYAQDNQKPADIFLIVHLDDSFIQGRLNTISSLTNENIPNIETIMRETDNFEKPDSSKNLKVLADGMHDLFRLIQNIKSRIININLKRMDTKVFLLNYTNKKNSKIIYAPVNDRIIEIENSNSVINKNLDQAKLFINYLYQNGILPYRNLSIEIVGVYKYACVNNIYLHLSNMIKDEKVPINVRVNSDLAI